MYNDKFNKLCINSKTLNKLFFLKRINESQNS
jgi:hypothetical protein